MRTITIYLKPEPAPEVVQAYITANIKIVDGHWIWNKSLNNRGYGMSKFGLSHRVAYAAYKGKIPQGLEIDHVCEIKACCNPEHLQALTHYENVGKSKVRSTTKMPRFTEKLTRHQLLLFEGDFDKLKSFYLNRSPTEVVRKLVRDHVTRIEERLAKEMEDA